VFLYIRKFLLVSYIVSVIFAFGWLYFDEVFDFFGLNDNRREEKLFELYIPVIKVYKNVYNMGSSLNNVDYNVEMLSNSNWKRRLFFLASHSGGGSASYFDDLVYLEEGDFILINGSDEKFVFVVEEMFYIQKNGYLDAYYGNDGNVLFLITCSLKYVDRQLVVKAKMIYEC